MLLVGQRLSGKYVDNTCQTRGGCTAVPYRGFKLGLCQKPLATFLWKCIGPKLPSQIRGSMPTDFLALRYIPN